jgi:hypothetical protein
VSSTMWKNEGSCIVPNVVFLDAGTASEI